MSIAKILVPVNGSQHDQVALATALSVAKPFNAHVQLVAVHSDPSSAIANVGVPLTTEAMQAIVDGQVRYAQAIDARIRELMTSICAEQSAAVVIKPQRVNGVSASFRHLRGDFERVVAKSASLSDLVVFSPVYQQQGADLSGAFLRILRSARRPVLVGKRRALGQVRKIVVGWDGSVAAAHALRHAMPLLRLSDQVVVLSVVREGRADPPSGPLSAYLSRHNVSFVCRRVLAGQMSPIGALLTESRGVAADMIVAGAYGHDQLWEALFGGATASMIADADIPVFLAH